MKFEFYHGLPAQARKIRKDVFVKEQGFLEEFDSDDHTRRPHPCFRRLASDCYLQIF